MLYMVTWIQSIYPYQHHGSYGLFIDDLYGFYRDFMGFLIVIQWDMNGIYPLVMTVTVCELFQPWHRTKVC